MSKEKDTGIIDEVSPGMVLDAAAKMLLQDMVLLADICNARIYGGMDVVKPDMITPRPVELNTLITRNDAIVTDNRFRDLAFFVNVGGRHGFVLCIEIQGTSDWRMPLRVHEYNIREYSRLSREPIYSSRHKLPLVVTLVFNFGHSAWKGAQSFLDLADYKDDRIAELAEQGRIVLIDPYNPDENFLSSLCTDWKIVLCSFSISDDAESLEDFARKINGMRLRRSTIDFMKVYFNMDLEIVDEDETGGQVNMCRAVTQIKQKCREEGREEGILGVVVNALHKNMSMKDIHELTGFSMEKIAIIAQSLETAKA